MIKFYTIENTELDQLINVLDDCMDFIKNEFYIELKTYGSILRIALNYVQEDSFKILQDRLSINTELEMALLNEGGYTLEYIGENNPKAALSNIISYLGDNLLKLHGLTTFSKGQLNKRLFVADMNDLDFLKKRLNNSKISIIPLSEVKKHKAIGEHLVFYSFNGKLDFDLIYNLSVPVTLIIYEQEFKLYQRQLEKRKYQIELEINAEDRQNICGLIYEPVIIKPVIVSPTIEKVVKRLDEFIGSLYNSYKDECDALLDDIEEKLFYKLNFTNDKIVDLESNETVFNSSGDLVKVYRVQIGETIRIYPKEHFAERLYDVAVSIDEEVFGVIEQSSNQWQSVLSELRKKHGGELYSRLKEKGLRVLPGTVDGYFNKQSKFPMFNGDLKAIFSLQHPDVNEADIDKLVNPIRKSKSIYSSTMIALGRGMKQEMKYYLKENKMGEILLNLKFSKATLDTFIDNFMPLLEISKKEFSQDHIYLKPIFLS